MTFHSNSFLSREASRIWRRQFLPGPDPDFTQRRRCLLPPPTPPSGTPGALPRVVAGLAWPRHPDRRRASQGRGPSVALAPCLFPHVSGTIYSTHGGAFPQRRRCHLQFSTSHGSCVERRPVEGEICTVTGLTVDGPIAPRHQMRRQPPPRTRQPHPGVNGAPFIIAMAARHHR
jgi:hypothetical protein